MPGLDGIAATDRCGGSLSRRRFSCLTTFDADESSCARFVPAPPAFCSRTRLLREIVRSIELVHAGDGTLSPQVARRLIALVAGDPDSGARHESALKRFDALSAREREVALAVGRGLANAEIAAELYMSVATVKAHVSRLLTKLGVENRVQIALLVQEAQRR